MANDPGDLITSIEAAVILGTTPGTIRTYVRRGHLTPALPLPGRHLFRRADVEALATERRERPNGRRRREVDGE